MTTSSLGSNFCTIRRNHDEGSTVVCQGKNDRIMGLVIFFIGAAFIATGLYLILGGTGTIPALTSGWGLLAVGVVFFAIGSLLVGKTFYETK